MNRFLIYSCRSRSRVRPRILNRFPFYAILTAMFVVTGCRGTAPKDASPASPPAPAKPAKSLPKIVAFGDSLTAGLGLPQSASYPSLLQKKLDADGFAYEVVNAGVSGDTSAGGVRRIDWALDGDVKIVIIERAKAHGATVLLAGMEAPTNSGAEYRQAVHETFPSLSREYNVPEIPFFLDGVAGIDSLNQRDGIHPNEAGTKVVTETVYRSLRPLLEKQGS